MVEKHGITCDLMHGFNWDQWTTGKPAERLAIIPAGQEHAQERMKDESQSAGLIIHDSYFSLQVPPPSTSS